jgi:deoxyribose-phosphate aldolase
MLHTDTQERRRLFGLIDLTRLSEMDTEADIHRLLTKACSPLGSVAAVCVLPRFVRLVAEQLSHVPIKTATVVNFPAGTDALEAVLAEITCVLQAGAQEVDVVFPYQRYIAGDEQYAHDFITACRAISGSAITLKVILETGVLNDTAMIMQACQIACLAGADFVKTSTGHTLIGATLEAVEAMLRAIQPHALKRRIGIKVSGGVKTRQQAMRYVQLAQQLMGEQAVTAATFRLGTSQLADHLLDEEASTMSDGLKRGQL